MPKLLCANPSCGREVFPSLPYQENYVFDGKKWFHTECYKAKYPKKDISKLIDKTKQYLETDFDSEQLFEYLKQEYNLLIISDSIKRRIIDLSNGADKDIREKISPTKLLEMFKYYYPTLAQSREYRRRSNIKEMAITGYGEPCLRHDLKVVLSNLVEYNRKVTSDEAFSLLNSQIKSIQSPDITPFIKRERDKRIQSGDILFQKALDSYMNDDDI